MSTSPIPSVWILDDDHDDLTFIRLAFQASQPSIDALTISNSDELLPLLASTKERPRLLLLDINMPRKNGFETLAELRSLPEYAELPVIMFTTSSNSVDQAMSMALGANQYLTKPVGYNQLRQLAQNLSQQWGLT
ncbi:response regulator [Spirosoma rigui]|uniref:response regulator n=1 Tax=Spirosoma rigui TaxID=564064 RepID=UPI0009AFDA77|nr:response regulator [Spirosoma rigui]